MAQDPDLETIVRRDTETYLEEMGSVTCECAVSRRALERIKPVLIELSARLREPPAGCHKGRWLAFVCETCKGYSEAAGDTGESLCDVHLAIERLDSFPPGYQPEAPGSAPIVYLFDGSS